MTKTILFLIFSCSLVYAALSQGEQVYLQGVNEFNELRYEEAIPLFKKAYRIDASNKDALYRLAVSYASAGMHKEAIISFNRLKTYKDYKLVYFELGKSFFALKKYKKAHFAFNSAIKSGDRIGESYFAKGFMNFKRNKYKSSVKSFIKVEKDDQMYEVSRLYAGVATYKIADDYYKAAILDGKKDSVDLSIYDKSKGYFNDVIAMSKNQKLAEKARRYLTLMNAGGDDSKNWSMITSLGYVNDSNVLSTDNVDVPTATTKSANKGTLFLYGSYKLINGESFLFEPRLSVNYDKYISSESDVYSNNSASITLDLYSKYSVSPATNYSFAYAYNYSYDDADADKKLAFSNYTNTFTPAATFQMFTGIDTSIELPVVILTNKDESESSNSLSMAVKLKQNYNMGDVSGLLYLKYESYNSKTNAYDKKKTELYLDTNVTIFADIMTNFSVTYLLGKYATSGYDTDKKLNWDLSLSKSFDALTAKINYSKEKQTGYSQYSKSTYGVNFSYSF